MTDLVSRLLDFLGGHFYHILLGCVLVIAAVLVLEFLDWRLRRIQVPEAGVSGSDRAMLKALEHQGDAVWILLRRSDSLPLSAVGDPSMLG